VSQAEVCQGSPPSRWTQDSPSGSWSLQESFCSPSQWARFWPRRVGRVGTISKADRTPRSDGSSPDVLTYVIPCAPCGCPFAGGASGPMNPRRGCSRATTSWRHPTTRSASEVISARGHVSPRARERARPPRPCAGSDMRVAGTPAYGMSPRIETLPTAPRRSRPRRLKKSLAKCLAIGPLRQEDQGRDSGVILSHAVPPG